MPQFTAQIKDKVLHISTDFKYFLQKQKDNTKFIIEINKIFSKRTLPQNNSIHLYCQQLADEFNAAGYDIKEVLKKITVIDILI